MPDNPAPAATAAPDTSTRQSELRILAESVMGWHYWADDEYYNGPDGETMFTDWGELDPPLGFLAVYEGGSEDVTHHWNPFTSIADAFMLVDALKKRGLNAKILTYSNGRASALIGPELYPDPFSAYPSGYGEGNGERATCEAICRAALALCEVQHG